MTLSTRPRWNRLGTGIALAFAATALLAAACSGTSSSDKTATAAAGSKPATSVATKASGAPTSAAGGSPTAAAATNTLKIVTDPTLGKFLTGSNGMTLYIFKNDVANSGKSAAEALAATWPPLCPCGSPVAGAGMTGALATITRADGKGQVTYNGLPLYSFVDDKRPGDTTGQGVNGVWFVAAP